MADYHNEDWNEDQFLLDRANEMFDEYECGILNWETKAGQEILVQDMLDIHIENTLKFFEKKSKKGILTEAWHEILTREFAKRQSS